MKLNQQEKQELRKIYGNYMNTLNNVDEYEYDEDTISRQDQLDAIKEKYKKQFPTIEAEISIENLDELVYSENQLKFIDEMLSEWRDIDYLYSGRGMYGDVCPAVRINDGSEPEIEADVCRDSMGMGYVLYARY